MQRNPWAAGFGTKRVYSVPEFAFWHPCTPGVLPAKKMAGKRRRSAFPPNDSPTGVELLAGGAFRGLPPKPGDTLSRHGAETQTGALSDSFDLDGLILDQLPLLVHQPVPLDDTALPRCGSFGQDQQQRRHHGNSEAAPPHDSWNRNA
jgi:hypothetical protein